MNYTLPAVLLAALALPQTPAVQTRPDFSGTWVMDPSRSESSVQNEPVKSMTVVITQTPYDVMIETRHDARVQTVTYRPGRPENPDAVSATSGRSGLITANWYWDGDKLVTEAFSDVNGMTVRTKAIHTLAANGTELAIESLVVVEHGYSLRGAKNYGFVKDIFTKAP
jgi:hypothetical protein